MSTLTLTDLPMSRALDFQAMSSIRGAGGAPWVFGAFAPSCPRARIAPIVNFYQTNFVADQLNVQFQNIDVDNSAANAVININAGQNALNFNFTAWQRGSRPTSTELQSRFTGHRQRRSSHAGSVHMRGQRGRMPGAARTGDSGPCRRHGATPGEFASRLAIRSLADLHRAIPAQ